MVTNRREATTCAGHHCSQVVAPAVLGVERCPVVDQPELAVPQQQIWIARRAVHILEEGIEPDHVRRQLRGNARSVRDAQRQRAGQIVQSHVQAGATFQQSLDFRVRFGQSQGQVEVDQHRLGHGEIERPAQACGDQLRDERLRTLARPTELDDVHAVVVRLHDGRQRAALAQGRDVPQDLHLAHRTALVRESWSTFSPHSALHSPQPYHSATGTLFAVFSAASSVVVGSSRTIGAHPAHVRSSPKPPRCHPALLL